jgi:4a-hydroxytetrahydrobiopterin dehydratase
VSSTLTLGAAAYEEPIKGDREMETLTQMKCVACRKDEPTVTDAEIAEFRPQVSDWEIVELDGIKTLETRPFIRRFCAGVGSSRRR